MRRITTAVTATAALLSTTAALAGCASSGGIQQAAATGLAGTTAHQASAQHLAVKAAAASSPGKGIDPKAIGCHGQGAVIGHVGQVPRGAMPTGANTAAAIYAQSSIPALHSCDMLFSDRPAAQPVITAAINAAVSVGAASSPARLRSELQEVLISDNPVASGSIIVTLLLPGAAYSSGVPNAPVLHHLSPVTVVMTYPGLHVTGAAKGGLP